MTSDTTMTTAEYALAEYRADQARLIAEREAREAADLAEIRAERAAIAQRAIAAHGWLFDHAGATYAADGDVIRTDDGLTLRASEHHSRGASEPMLQIRLVWLCDECRAATEAADDYSAPPIRSILDLGNALEIRAAAGPVYCADCLQRQYEDWAAAEDDAPADDDDRPSQRPARSGWVYLPTRAQFINGAAIESVQLDDAAAAFVVYVALNADGVNSTDTVRDADDVRALTRWLEGGA